MVPLYLPSGRMTRSCQGSPFEHWCDAVTNPADLPDIVAPLFPALFSVTLYTHVTTQWCGAAVSSRLFACRVCVCWLACQLKRISKSAKEAVTSVPITELPVVAAVHATARARAVVAEIQASGCVWWAVPPRPQR